MNILVTGGTGFTGGHLCQRLVGQGHHVRTLSRRGSAVELLRNMGVEIMPGDLCDPAAIATAVQGVDSVYHIAALYRQQKGEPRQFWQHQYRGRGISAGRCCPEGRATVCPLQYGRRAWAYLAATSH